MTRRPFTDPGDITELLLGLEHDRDRVIDLLFPKVYEELRVVAGTRLRAEREGHTLSATALIHEACGGLRVIPPRVGLA